MLADAFAHHVWATLRVVDACLALGPEQLETAVPGTYGSILQTVRHLVGADAWYLSTMMADDARLIDDEGMSIPELRAVMEGHGAAWSRPRQLHLVPQGARAGDQMDVGAQR